MSLRVGTILEPLYDRNIEHAVVVSVIRFDERGDVSYEIETVKSKNRAFMLPHEIYRIYEPIGQAKTGQALFGGNNEIY